MGAPEASTAEPPQPTSDLAKILLDFDARLKRLEAREPELAKVIEYLKRL